MKQKPKSRVLTTRIPLLALAAFSGVAHAQATRTWDGGGTGNTNMDTAANWSGDVIPNGSNNDIAQFNGTVTGPLSLTYTATTANGLAAGNGVFFNVLGSQTDSIAISEASGTNGLRLQNLTVASGAGALTFGTGGATVNDFLTLGATAVTNLTWTNSSANPVTFNSDVGFGAGGGNTKTFTLTGTGNWNMNASLIRTGSGTINVVKDGTGTLNANNVNALGNAAFTMLAGTLDNTSGAAVVLVNTTQTWNGDFSYSTGAGTNLNDLSLGAGTVSLGTAAGTSRTITANGTGVLAAGGVVSNGTTVNSIIKMGTGGLRFDGNNLFTGGITLNAGSLHIGNNGAVGTGPLTINGGVVVPRLAARTIANATTVNSDFTVGVGGFNNQMNFSGTVNLAGGTRAITVANTTVDPDAIISGVISNGGLTKAGAGTMFLTGTNTFTGATSVTEGILRLDGTGSVNTSSGITINGSGAKFVHTGSVAVTPAVNVTQGTLDGTGTLGAVNVGDSASAIVANGNGGTATLTTGALTFAGAATVNLASTTTGVGIAAGTLSTSGTDGAIAIKIARTGVWANGLNNLISFTSLPSADMADFDVEIISGPTLGARQTVGDLVLNGNNIALEIIGTSVYWTGLQSNQWTFNTVPGLKNWKQTVDNAATDFLDGDDVVFNDTPGADQAIQIDDGNIITTTTIFNNSAVNYSFSSSGAFGIASGSVTKGGSGSVTFNTANSYSGGTTLNAGTINVNTATALGTGALVINGGTLDNTSGGPVTLTANSTQAWNGDFSFTGSNSLDMGTGNVTSGPGGDRIVTVSANALTVGELKTAANQGFTKQGAGTLVLTSDGSNTAASVVNGLLTVSGGTLQINRASGVTGDLLAAGITGSGTVTNGAATERWLFSNATTGTFDFPGTVANGAVGALGFNKSGGSTQTLSGNNTFSGTTTVAGGTLILAGTNSLSGPTNITAGTLRITGSNSAGGAVSVNGGATPAFLNLQNSLALGTSVVTAINRNSGIQLQGGISLPNTVSFITSNDGTSGATVPYAINNVSGDNTINGSITLTAGGGPSVIQSDSGSLTLAGPITIAAAQTSRGIWLQGASTGANTVSGVVSDLSGTSVNSITKNGSGTWTVTGLNTYSGVTAVNAGTLIVSGDNSGAHGAVTVASGATLGGNGNLGGSVTIAAGGIHSLAVAATSGAQVPRAITGALVNTGSTLHLTAAATPAAGVYTLVTTTGGITGVPTVTGFTGGVVSISGNNLILTVSAGYDAWALAKGLDGTNNGPEQDNGDFDGIPNVLEFVLDGNPLAPDTHKLPVQTQDATNFYFDFNRRDDAVTDVTLTFQYGTLIPVLPSSVAIPASKTPIAGPPVTITDNGNGTHHVKVTVAKSGAVALFGRLHAVK